MNRRLPLLLLLVLAVAGITGAIALRHRGGGSSSGRAAACRATEEHEREGGQASHREEEAEREREGAAGQGGATGAEALYRGPAPIENPCGERPGTPEPFADLAKANASIAARSVAPGRQVRPGAYRAAVTDAEDLEHTAGDWQEFGRSPLETGRQEFDETAGSTRQGLGNVAGRMTTITRGEGARLFAGGSNAGVWTSTDNGDHWSSVSDTLPTQVVSGIAWTTAGGGRLLVLTGDNAFGGSTFAGLGAYWTDDLGKTWHHASGTPDGVLGFKLVVDPSDASRVYAGTGAGLYRSTDGGDSYTNVNLPTGQDAGSIGKGTPNCTGKSPSVKNCFLANMVTDVVVQGPGNAQTPGAKPGAVLAAVGWRGGSSATNEDGSSQSPGNGIYRSNTGATGTFTNVRIEDHNVPMAGGDPLTKPVIGRTALGIAHGPGQNHNIVYALIQDAVKFNGGAGGLDVSEEGIPNSDYLNGIWASTDLGATWRELDGSNHMDSDPSSNSALAPPVCKAVIVSYCPGVQAWYNLWIEPDPTRTSSTGAPSRYAFGLEEVWSNDTSATPPTGLDGTTPVRSRVIGRYYANETCTLLNATNGLPVCPTAEQGTVPKTTTHPDQHGALWLPDASGGGVTLFAANDGGIYKQHRAAGEELTNRDWGTGSNGGLHTLQPYDIAIAKDGTAYMGLQDNGEQKVDPDGRSYTVYGGDGFFSAVDPDNAKIAYEEYTNGDISVTKDGGKTWDDIQPSGMTAALFSTPFEMDANDANHLMIGGRNIFETTKGPGTTSSNWDEVYDLGTRTKPGDANATASGKDANNQLSAVDVHTLSVPGDAPTGPHTADFAYSGGAGTVPGGQSDITGVLPRGTFPPGTYTDRPFKVGPGDGNASLTTTVTWDNRNYDWDLYVYKKAANGSLEEVGSSAQGDTTSEQTITPNPGAGDYVIRVVNFAAAGTFNASAKFAQRTSSNASLTAAYAGFCGFCDTITQGVPFGNGIATNVAGPKPAKAGTSDGWHIAKATGLPSRYITSVRMDPDNPSTVYVTLAGYGRRWALPGARGEDTSKVGSGHVFKSTDAAQTFTDVSGDLPDVPANWSLVRDGRLIVGTDIGVFTGSGSDGGHFAVLGRGLPTVPVSTLRMKPGDPDLLFTATFGRGAYSFKFTKQPAPTGGAAPLKAPSSCSTARGFKSVKVKRTKKGLRFVVKRRVNAPFTVDVFRETIGNRVLKERRVAHFPKRRRSFTWSRSGRQGNGIYFARVRMLAGGFSDARRVPLRRAKGKFTVRKPFFELRRCKVLRLARLRRPVFGGSRKANLRVSVALRRAGSITVAVRRGKKTVLRKVINKAGRKTYRVVLSGKRKLPRGVYRVTVTARSGGAKETAVLRGRRV